MGNNKRIYVNSICQTSLNYNVKHDKELGFGNEIYTDGSKLNMKVGCAVCCL